MSKAELENGIRAEAIGVILEAINAHYELEDGDVLRLSASELAIPVLDAERNESWVKVAISVPRGTRNGNGGYNAYDPYPQAEDYRLELEQRQQKKDASAAKKQAAEAARAAKKAAKQTIKELNTKGLDAMIHEGE